MDDSRSNNRRPYVIYTMEFNESVGGIIALHQLCELLNTVGEKAYIWPVDCFVYRDWLSYVRCFIAARLKKLFGVKFKTCHSFNTPLATKKILRNAIVVYPEVVAGNPLGAKYIVRWFLNKPGHFTGRVKYGKNELYFFYAEYFNDAKINSNFDHALKTLFIRDDIYYEEAPRSERKGTCYILRKGKGRKLVHGLTDSILIDDLSHEQAAKVFNHSEFCISYDTYTMLSKYAAMCGCVSIVIPEEGVPKEHWRPNANDRLGIAYGFDDIQWAKDTQGQVLQNYQEQQSRTIKQLEYFISRTQSKFLR